ncbi:MAG: UbiD family decarboxylase domain-containing protein, partial [Bradyrhizobium sp.]
MERKPIAFGDMRNWMKALNAAGDLREIDAEVDWNVELGTVVRMAQGTGNGPALLFSNIKDYNKNTTRCGSVFAGGLGSYRRVAMMMGLAPDTHPRELVKIGRTINEGRIPPRIVKEGPCKENVVTGKDIDLYEFPVPQWNRVDGGRYLLTYGGVVTKDPTTNVMNVGVYRGMVSAKDRIPILMWRAQHIGHHVTAWQNGG